MFSHTVKPSYFPALVQSKAKPSFLFAVVVSVGIVHHTHFIVENHVTVRLHTLSCIIFTLILCPTLIFDRAIVIFQAGIVILCMFASLQSSVAVAQALGVYERTLFRLPFIVGFVNTGFVIVCTPVNVFAASVLAIVALVEGKVIVVPSVPESVSVFDTVSFFHVATLAPI